ncbi:Rhodanese-like domain-containing protein [Exophiala viscosa]|uniref:Rhodanese-like domain-containing protein n=1 Tax=Exophiala viscosa TaxID=2486360 RepID=A0AAN6ICZ0_9EURO|nr:Rhodanese-like domain-containing protein [Exophiala viscosa]
MASKRAFSTVSRSLERISTSSAATSTTAIAARSVQRILPASSVRLCSKPPFPSSMPLRQPKRHFTTTLVPRKDDPSSAPGESKVYNFADIQGFADKPSPNRILIDVREPGELQNTGKIPGSHNLPVKTASDAFFLPPDEFEDRLGWQKPGDGDEVIFYCKAGVRSRAAAQLAQRAGFGGKVGEYPGSWDDWAGKGGKVEREK